MKTLERKKLGIGRTPDNFALIDGFCIGFAGNSVMDELCSLRSQLEYWNIGALE